MAIALVNVWPYHVADIYGVVWALLHVMWALLPRPVPTLSICAPIPTEFLPGSKVARLLPYYRVDTRPNQAGYRGPCGP